VSSSTPTLALPAEGLSLPRSREALAKEQAVARLFEAFSTRRLDDALPLLAQDVVFLPMTAQVTRDGEAYRGHEGIARYLLDVQEQWDELTLRPTQIKAAGDAVVALGLVSGRGAFGSFEDAPTTWMFKFRGALVAHVQIFSDTSHLLAALGEAETIEQERCRAGTS
jgi:ketosteroid isomerase-like protein